MKTKIYLSSKELENSDFRRFEISIRLDDECHNGHDDFAITANGWYKDSFRRDSDIGGCCNDEILKLRPDLKIFVDLHLCNSKGQPMYPIENGWYWLFNEEKPGAVLNNLRITENERDILKNSGDKIHFQMQLENLGIIERWKNEAKEAIKLLEKMTGQTYADSTTHPTMSPLTDEQRADVMQKLESGYYTVEEVNKRRLQAIEDKKNAIIAELTEKAEEEKDAINTELKIDLYLIKSGVPRSNYIYYSHKNELVFNWNPPYNQITREFYDSFIDSVDLSQFPEGIKFKFGK